MFRTTIFVVKIERAHLAPELNEFFSQTNTSVLPYQQHFICIERVSTRQLLTIRKKQISVSGLSFHRSCQKIKSAKFFYRSI